MTLADGTYAMQNLNQGNFTVIASDSNYQTQTVGIRIQNNRTEIVDFALVPNGGTISGTVIDAGTTLPISGASVEIFQGLTLIITVTTDIAGFYTAPDLEPGIFYTVNAAAPGYSTLSQGATVQAGVVTTVDFALQFTAGGISGTVTDAVTTNPIQDAFVEVFDGSTLIGFANTDVMGMYTILDLAPGSYTVNASADGYQSKAIGASVIGGATTMNVDFALDPFPGTIAGTVTDASTGLPIPGAAIDAFQGVTLVASVLTDPNGQYTLSDFAPGDYLVRANANLYQQQIKAATVTSNTTTTVDFALVTPPGTISGTAKDAVTMALLPGVAVNVYNGQTLIGSAVTDPNGFYQIQNLSPGNYTVTASKATYQTQAIGATVTAGATTTVDFALVLTPGTISGTVTDAVTTSPIEGASVSVFSGQTFIANALTDVMGNYTIPNLAPGQYTVIARAGTTYQTASQGATVIGGMTTTVDFALQLNPGAITGTVTNASNGQPLPGTTISVYSNLTVIGSALTDANGLYSINELAPGNYTVVASAPGFNSSAVGAIVTANTTTVVDFALAATPGTISGTVIDAVTMSKIPGAAINVFSGQTLIASALTDSNGFYQIQNLSPDNYAVTASKATYQTQAIGAMVTAGTTTTVDFALIKPPGTITGTVTDAVTTNPIEGASVSVFSGQTFIANALTDAMGKYTIPDLEPGQYTVIARAGTTYQTASQGATVIGGMTTTVDFALQLNPGAIAGTVTNTFNGKPIPGTAISVYSNLTVIGSALTDANGSYSIIGLAAGNYTVVANAKDFNIVAVGAVVTAGNTTIVNFALEVTPGTISGTVRNAATSMPIPGTAIEVRNGPILIASAITDPNGRYSIPNLEPDIYFVTAIAVGFQAQAKIATVSPSQTTIVDFSLNPVPGAISGFVRDAVTTNPIVNATVAVFDGTTLINSALTAVNGSYTVPDLAPGNYIVLVIAQGYQEAFSGETVVSGATTMADFALNRNPGTIFGRVTEQCTGGPVPGVLILVTNGSTIVGYELTDGSGSYSIDTLAPGIYSVTAAKKNFVAATSMATVIANARTRVNFSLVPFPLPPTSISGCAVKNKFLTQTDLVYVISWTASPSSCLTGYQIFRNGIQIASVPPTTLEYQDHNRNKETNVYSVQAVNSFGLIGAPISVTISNNTKCR